MENLNESLWASFVSRWIMSKHLKLVDMEDKEASSFLGEQWKCNQGKNFQVLVEHTCFERISSGVDWVFPMNRVSRFGFNQKLPELHFSFPPKWVPAVNPKFIQN